MTLSNELQDVISQQYTKAFYTNTIKHYTAEIPEGISREHSPLGEASLYGWSPV